MAMTTMTDEGAVECKIRGGQRSIYSEGNREVDLVKLADHSDEAVNQMQQPTTYYGPVCQLNSGHFARNAT